MFPEICRKRVTQAALHGRPPARQGTLETAPATCRVVRPPQAPTSSSCRPLRSSGRMPAPNGAGWSTDTAGCVLRTEPQQTESQSLREVFGRRGSQPCADETEDADRIHGHGACSARGTWGAGRFLLKGDQVNDRLSQSKLSSSCLKVRPPPQHPPLLGQEVPLAETKSALDEP